MRESGVAPMVARGAAVPQSTASPPQRVPQSTAKRVEPVVTGPRFAVLSDGDIEDVTDFDFFQFAGLDAKVWRVECRYRMRKDGKEIMYWNYRRRKIHHDDEGNRRIEYRKGGSRVR